jgi:hypothetical protein
VSEPFPLYHWSPRRNRGSILRRGIDINRLSPDRVWRPPCSCWASNPELAWVLSGKLHAADHKQWDLWMTWSDVPKGMEEIVDYYRNSDKSYVKEYRIYERVYKRDLWYVGTRDA